MNKLHLFLFLFFTPFFTHAVEPCGTVMPEDMKAWLKEYQQKGLRIDLRGNNNRPMMYIPIKVHILGDNSGTGYYSVHNLYRVMCRTNEQFEKARMHFYIHENINYINNSSWYMHDFQGGSIMIATNNVPNVVNVYFVADAAGNCGYFSGWVDGVVIANSCAGPNSTTVAHELGHYFSLPHTFSGWEGGNPPASSQQERVDGSNCATAGDGFCDTPPDYVSNRWFCPYGGWLTDPAGVQFKPDGSYFMSYSSDACQDKFSEEQILAMRGYTQNSRSYLLNWPQFPFPTVEATQTYLPANGATVPSNFVVFSWKRSAGATHYHFFAENFSVQPAPNFNQLLTDTFFIAQLPQGITYYWSVAPINKGNTCAGFVSNKSFTTGPPLTIVPAVSSTDVSCPGASNGSALVTASGGTQPYTFLWSTGATTPSISNLSPGSYSVTIYDQNSDSIVLPVGISQPSNFSIRMEETSNSSFYAITTGGTPPYTFSWSNGGTGSQILLGEGSYSVTITDSKGCSSVEQVSILRVNATVVEAACYGEPSGAINVSGVDFGQGPYQFSWSNGETSQSITGISAGTYYLTVTDASGNERFRSYQVVEPANLSTVIFRIDGNRMGATVSGGTPPYTYEWSDGSNTDVFYGAFDADYSLQVSDANGCINSVNFFFEVRTSVDEPGASDFYGLELYPNPVADVLSINWVTQRPIQESAFRILDLTGRVLHTEVKNSQTGLNRHTLSVSEISEGVYFLQIELENAIARKKFVVIR